MAVTRSRATEREPRPRGGRRAFAPPRIVWRRREALWMLAASALLLFGFVRVYRAKTRSFAEIDAALASKQLINLNDLAAREDLLPALAIFTDPAARAFVARRIYDAAGTLPNVGAIARLRVSDAEVQAAHGVKSFSGRHALLSGEQFRALKPSFVVRLRNSAAYFSFGSRCSSPHSGCCMPGGACARSPATTCCCPACLCLPASAST